MMHTDAAGTLMVKGPDEDDEAVRKRHVRMVPWFQFVAPEDPKTHTWLPWCRGSSLSFSVVCAMRPASCQLIAGFRFVVLFRGVCRRARVSGSSSAWS